MHTRNAVLRSLAAILSVTAAHAGDFAAGMEAYRAGDHAAAIAEWTPLAEEGLVEAQFNLGLIYGDPDGDAADPAAAERWFLAAAEQGFHKAQFNLGRLYEEGRGVERDLVAAYKWFKLAEDGKVPGSRKARKGVAKRMTPKEIALGDLGCREWKRKRKSGG